MFPQLLAVSMAIGAGINGAQAPPPGAGPLRQLKISAPEAITTLKVGELKGTPTRLAWAPDGAILYLRVSRFDRWGNETVSHVQLAIKTRQVSRLELEPAWARRYWDWKSAAWSPALPGWRIKFESRQEKFRTTNVPGEGGIGQHTADPTASLDEIVRKAALANQLVQVETLTLGAIILDQGVNQPVLPGRTFSWAPAPAARIVHVNDKGRLVVTQHGEPSREIAGTQKASLPAWSEDGGRIVYLERKKDDQYVVRLITVR